MFTFPAGFIGSDQAYYANAVNFDGSNDYLTYTSAFTGMSDGKSATFSTWFKRATTGEQYIIDLGVSNATRFAVYFDGINWLIIEGKNAAGATILSAQRQTSFTDTTNWHHLSVSFDLANASNRAVYLDGSAATISWGTYTNDSIDFTTTDNNVGSRNNNGSKWNGDLADVYLETGTYTDLSTNNDWYDAGKPANPLLIGSPQIVLNNPTATWHTNAASGGGLTENGALTTASTSPSD